MLKLLLQKISIAILSTIILSIFLSYIGHTPKVEQTEGTLSYGFKTLFIIYSIYIAFIYLTVGILTSWLIEHKIKSQLKRILYYAISGAIVGGGFYLFFTPQDTNILQRFFSFALLGILGALILWGFQRITDSITVKVPLKIKNDRLL